MSVLAWLRLTSAGNREANERLTQGSGNLCEAARLAKPTKGS
jgi:hypothetical protein